MTRRDVSAGPYIEGRSVHVCNVGDSRATLGEVNSQGRLRAVDLSHDQTPFRDDECQRVKAAGARYGRGLPDVARHVIARHLNHEWRVRIARP